MLPLAILSTFIIGDPQTEVTRAKAALETAVDKTLARVELAKALWIDQDHENAICNFIKALDEYDKIKASGASIADAYIMDDLEKVHFDAAMQIYLSSRPEDARVYSLKLLNNYGPLFKQNPSWARVGFLVALAEANLQEFDAFFIHFFESYKKEPTHFLSLKTLAILHIKLFEKAKTPLDKEKERSLIMSYLARAAEIYPSDLSLIRLQISFASKEDKATIMKQVLNKILQLNIIPPRADALYYAEAIRSVKDKDFFLQWVRKGLEWYPDSRSFKQLEVDGIKNTW